VESRRVSRVLALLVGVAGIALSASGCVIKDSSTPACLPDLVVRWRIVASGSVVPPTCDEVGATTIRVNIAGDVTDFSCPLGQSTGSIPFYLDLAGTYAVSVSLLDGSTVLAQGSTSAIVDCSGLSQTSVVDLAPGGGCSPDLTISWLITSNLDGAALTCYEAGNATSVVATIDGGGLGTNLTDFASPCPANADSGSFVALLPTTGTYDIAVELRSGATVLSTTPVLTKVVDCSGLSATPPAELFVNF